MIELDPSARDHVLAGLRLLPINTLFVQSVLCGHVDGGFVRADDPRAPRALYALHPYGMALLWGTPADRSWHAWLRGPQWLQVYPLGWVEEVEAVLGDRALRCTRVNFSFDREAYLREREGVAGAIAQAAIVPTSVELFTRIDGSVVPKKFWRDGPQFVRQAGGFSLILDGEVAATAFCSYRHGAQLEIGIETAPRHRGRGLARLVACVLIDDCLRRNLEPVWACRLENQPSYRLAKKLGFVPTAHLPYYQLPPSAP